MIFVYEKEDVCHKISANIYSAYLKFVFEKKYKFKKNIGKLSKFLL